LWNNVSLGGGKKTQVLAKGEKLSSAHAVANDKKSQLKKKVKGRNNWRHEGSGDLKRKTGSPKRNGERPRGAGPPVWKRALSNVVPIQTIWGDTRTGHFTKL